MLLERIFISQFRCFEHQEISFHASITAIIGPNARGKTSILESIMTCLYGRGFREAREIELVRHDQESALLSLDIGDERQRFQLSMKIQRVTESTVKKDFVCNKSKVTFKRYRSHGLHAVLFAPQHINIITGSPTRRRDYIDSILTANSVEYGKRLRNYHTALRKRNKILESWSDEVALIRELQFWDEYLIEHAQMILDARTRYIVYLNSHQAIADKSFRVVYIPDSFSEARLKTMRKAEFRARRTLIGPQKDEYRVYIEGERSEDVQLFGSRSQQRMAVFWLKLNELHYLHEQSGVRPALLLDDIFSELDAENRRRALQMVLAYQTVVTTTEQEIVNMLPNDMKIIAL